MMVVMPVWVPATVPSAVIRAVEAAVPSCISVSVIPWVIPAAIVPRVIPACVPRTVPSAVMPWSISPGIPVPRAVVSAPVPRTSYAVRSIWTVPVPWTVISPVIFGYSNGSTSKLIVKTDLCRHVLRDEDCVLLVSEQVYGGAFGLFYEFVGLFL